jgi:hypothetical protein
VLDSIEKASQLELTIKRGKRGKLVDVCEELHAPAGACLRVEEGLYTWVVEGTLWRCRIETS